MFNAEHAEHAEKGPPVLRSSVVNSSLERRVLCVHRCFMCDWYYVGEYSPLSCSVLMTAA